MKMVLALGCAFALALIFASSLARACGDTNVGANHQPAWLCANGAQSAVLVYSDPAAGEGSLLADPALSVTLTSAGFSPLVVTSLDDVRQALAEGSFAVVLASLETAPAVRPLLEVDGAPVLLPVIDGGTKEDARAAEASYGRVVRAPVRARTLTDAVAAAARR